MISMCATETSERSPRLAPFATADRARTRVRSAYHGVRKGRPAVDRDTGDVSAEIVSLVEEPYTDVPETTRRLDALERTFRESGDRRGVFLTIYARVTEEVGAGIRRDEFDDPDWVADYLVRFANLYRQAVYDFETGNLRDLADPWQLAFEAAQREAGFVVQDAALGINAHINYDLAFALDDVGVDPDRPAKYEDHRAVTDVLRRTVDEVQDALAETYAPGLATVDELLGTLDDLFAVFTVDQARESAWRAAVALNSRLRARRRLARWVTRVTSTGAAYLILTPNASSTALDALREIEGTPTDDRTD